MKEPERATFTNINKNYQNRANVKRFLPVWEKFIKNNGREMALNYLLNKHTKHIGHKDRMGLIIALGLEDLYAAHKRRESL